MFSAERRDTLEIRVGLVVSLVPSTSSKFDAGSVLTSNTRLPLSARVMAVAQATEVLPTPPLPVKNTMRRGSRMSEDIGVLLRTGSHGLAHADCGRWTQRGKLCGTT